MAAKPVGGRRKVRARSKSATGARKDGSLELLYADEKTQPFPKPVSGKDHSQRGDGASVRQLSDSKTTHLIPAPRSLPAYDPATNNQSPILSHHALSTMVCIEPAGRTPTHAFALALPSRVPRGERFSLS